MIKLLFFSLLQLLIFISVHSQNYSTWKSKQLTLDNGIVRRTIVSTDNGGFFTRSLLLNGNEKDFVRSGSEEFSFLLNDKPFNGTGGWKIISYETISDKTGGKGAVMRIRGTEEGTKNLEIEVSYVLYPDLPVIRKKIKFKNAGKSDLKLEGLEIEKLMAPYGNTNIFTYGNFARDKWYGQLFTGNECDPLVIVHHFEQRSGIALGNEAPGIMKKTTVLEKNGVLSIGLPDPGEVFAFRKWLKPGESWESPWTFIAPYSNESGPYQVVNGPVNDFVRKHMGIRLNEIPVKPGFIYNTWRPFLRDITDTLILQLADVAAECGVEEFIIDDGWQDNYGDWGIDKKKFPNGLKPVFDYIKSKGMKPGLWISLSTAQSDSKVFNEHPEWMIVSKAGTPINLHSDYDSQYGLKSYTMSMATGWKDYIKGKILYLVKEHGLEYIKADFGVVTGAYTFDKYRSGDHSTRNKFYRDREESLLVLYRKLWELFDELHVEAPELFIDCTFEAMGGLHLIDYDMCKHAEGNWLSNIDDLYPYGGLRVRNLAWSRSPVMPATAMVIGNLQLNEANWEFNLKSLIGTLPIVLGDLREIDPPARAQIRQWSDWMKKMQAEYNFMMYRQDLPGFGEPSDMAWDGWSRINTDTKNGGLVGVFRQNAVGSQRTVSVKWLNDETIYEIRKAPGGEPVGKYSGLELREKGFEVTLEDKVDAELFEIKKVN